MPAGLIETLNSRLGSKHDWTFAVNKAAEARLKDPICRFHGNIPRIFGAVASLGIDEQLRGRARADN